MAETDGFEMIDGLGGQVGSIASGAADTILIVISVMIGIGILVIGWLLIKDLRNYVHRVKIRVITSDSSPKFIEEDVAKTIIQDGVPYWKLKKRKELLTVPPSECTELTKKGKYYAECYWSEREGFRWIKDVANPEAAFDAFPTTEKALLVQRIKNAQARKKKGIWDMLQALVTPIVLVMLFVLVLIFWEDIAEPTIKVLNKVESITASQAVIAQQQARITAVLAGQAEAGTLELEQTINPEGGG